MTDHTPPRALVIGGSLAGLLTALTLRRIGWRVDVFERSPHALDSRGGGLVLQPELLHAFRFAGLAPGGTLGVASGDRIFLDRDGQVLERSYQPQTQTSWNMLYGVMRRALPDACVHAGETLQEIAQRDGKVTARFAGGRRESGDLLVGADGARSALRAQLLPGLQPAYAGYVAWRGLVPEAELDAASRLVLDGTFAFQQGEGHMLLEYMVPGETGATARGQRRWNWVWYRRVEKAALTALLTDRTGKAHAWSLPPGALADTQAHRLRTDAGAMLAPPFAALVGRTASPFVQAILDLDTPAMVFGRAILLGDAAFVPRPHTAGSAAKAAADALSLAQALQGHGSSLERRLPDWERRQLHAGSSMTAWGRQLGDRIMGLGGTVH